MRKITFIIISILVASAQAWFMFMIKEQPSAVNDFTFWIFSISFLLSLNLIRAATTGKPTLRLQTHLTYIANILLLAGGATIITLSYPWGALTIPIFAVIAIIYLVIWLISAIIAPKNSKKEN